MNTPNPHFRTLRRAAWLTLAAALLAACVGPGPREAREGIGQPVPWSRLTGWQADAVSEAWPALLQSCQRLAGSQDSWARLCLAARELGEVDDATARAFLETWFVPHELIGPGGEREGLVTGYYEPQLNGSRKRTRRYRYAIYGAPKDLLTIDLGEVYPELANMRLRGRLKGQRVVPYYSREQIHNGHNPLAGHELLWVDDPVALFFLHIQGSGIVRLRDGSLVSVGYTDQNGHPYHAIGTELIRRDEIAAEDISLQTIRDWMHDNPDEAEDLMNRNPSYVFFESRGKPDTGPLGSLGVPLTPTRSIAVDRRQISLGLPVWLETTLPLTEPSRTDDKTGSNGEDEEDGDKPTDKAPEGIPYRRLVFAQDTGGAINGAVRADLFWGRGKNAESLAGRMKQHGRMYVLLPRRLDGRQPADGTTPSLAQGK